MARFFFDVEWSEAIANRITADLPDMEAARFYAQGMIEVMMHGRGGDAWRVTILSGKNETLQVMSSEEASEDTEGD